MTTHPLLTRKQIAQLLGVSVDIVRRNERQLGILEFKVKLNKRVVYYRAKESVRELKAIGMLS